MQNLKRLVLVAAVLFFAGAVGTVARQEIVLDFPSWQRNEPGTSDWYLALIAEYEQQHPGVRIDFNFEPFPTYVQKMITRFAGGNPPDVVHLPAANLFAFVNEGWLEPLNSRLAQTDISQTWNPLQSWCQVEGETFCVLVLGFGFVLGYNQAMFDAAGVTVPTNPDELLAAASALTRDTDGDGAIDQFGFAMPTVTHPGVYDNATMFVLNAGGNWVDDAGNLNRQAIIDGLLDMKRFVDAGVVPPGLDNNGKRQFFTEGRAAMMIEGPWIEGFINSAPPEVRPNLQVAPVPFPAFGGVSNVLAVASDIPQARQDLVWEFIALAASQEWQEKYAEITGSPPARRDSVTAAALEAHPNLTVYVQEAQEAVNRVPAPLAREFTRFQDLVIDAVLQVIVGGRPAEEVVDKLAQEITDQDLIQTQ